jgi:hypothetical protein
VSSQLWVWRWVRFVILIRKVLARRKWSEKQNLNGVRTTLKNRLTVEKLSGKEKAKKKAQIILYGCAGLGV